MLWSAIASGSYRKPGQSVRRPSPDEYDEAELQADLPDDLAARLIMASRHRFGRAIETIINAIECALFDRSQRLLMEHFVEAWAMQEGCAPSANIFDANDWLSLSLDGDAEAYEAARTKRQRKKVEKG